MTIEIIQSDRDALKPCPCCKAPGYLITNTVSGAFKVKCIGCELQTKPSLYRNEAITAWNTRPSDSWRPIESLPENCGRLFLWCTDPGWNGERHAQERGLCLGRSHEGIPYGDGLNGDWTFTHWAPILSAPTPPEGTS